MNIVKRGLALTILSVMILMGNVIYSLAYGAVAVQNEYSLSMEQAASEEYKLWKEHNWTEEISSDSGNIVLTPGRNETRINFAWYSEQKGTPGIKLATKQDMTAAVIFSGNATDIKRFNWKKTYISSNKVTATDLVEGMKYYYCYSDDIDNPEVGWSDIYSFTTKVGNSFQVAVVGDPQIGASGSEGEGTAEDVNIPADTFQWKNLLGTICTMVPDISFLMSVGDQINYKTDSDAKGVREGEYAGFLYPMELRSLPLAPTIGNHETMGVDFKYHFNTPNSQSRYAATASGGDYFFSYKEALFIVLNSNSRKMDEHKKAMKEAVESHPNAKWRIVMFHHDIYGSGILHSNANGANMRILFAPLMDEYKIDVAISGHDHSYARSYQIIDGTAVNYGAGEAINPVGTMYLAVGSSTGSTFYGLAERQYYVAERSNAWKQTFSILSFAGEAMTLKTFDIDGQKYANDFTITKTKQKQSPMELIKGASDLQKENYSKKSYDKMASAMKKLQTLLKLITKDNGYQILVNQNGKSNDPLTYYGHAIPTYADRLTGTTKLKQGFSSLLDKTTQMNLCITNTSLEKASLLLETSTKQLKKTSLLIKKGKKKIKAGATISLKKGKSLQLKVTAKPKGGKISFTSSAKKYVSVTKKGKVKAIKKRKAPVTITIKFEYRVQKLKIKVK